MWHNQQCITSPASMPPVCATSDLVAQRVKFKDAPPSAVLRAEEVRPCHEHTTSRTTTQSDNARLANFSRPEQHPGITYPFRVPSCSHAGTGAKQSCYIIAVLLDDSGLTRMIQYSKDGSRLYHVQPAGRDDCMSSVPRLD